MHEFNRHPSPRRRRRRHGEIMHRHQPAGIDRGDYFAAARAALFSALANILLRRCRAFIAHRLLARPCVKTRHEMSVYSRHHLTM